MRHNRNDAFLERRNTGAHDPVSSRIVWCYVDTLFRQPIDRCAVRDQLGSDVLMDVDLRGNPVDDWLSNAYYQGLGFGWAVAVVDMDTSGEDIPSAAHAPREFSRPYAQIYTPLRVWDIEFDEFDRIVRLVIRESETHLRVWTEYSSSLHDIGSGKIVDMKTHGFGYVPAALFRANDSNVDNKHAPPGESAVKAISLFDLQILQQISLLNDVEKKTGFPFLHVKRDALLADDSPEGDQTLGSDFILSVEADVGWKAPPPSSPQEIRDYCDWLESRAYKIGGVHRRSQDSVEAHSGLALDYENSPIYATVQRWARRLRTFELKIWRIFSDIMGGDSSKIDVLYPDDFSNRPVAQDIGVAKELTAIYGGYRYAPVFVQAGIDALSERIIERSVGNNRRVKEALALQKNAPLEIGRSKDETERDTETREPSIDGEDGSGEAWVEGEGE